jgi:peptide/nickel transport system permease protein
MAENTCKKINKRKTNLFLKSFFSRGLIVKISVVFAVIFIFCAIFAPVLAPSDPNQVDLPHKFAKISPEHLLGTDDFGRDVVSRLLFGARVSFVCSFLSCLAGAAIGILLGLLAGYYEGVVGTIIMRYVDIQLSIPPLIFTIVISLFVGSNIAGIVFALSFGLIPTFIRMMYGLVLQLKYNDYVVAARIVGVKSGKILFKHLLPNTFPSMIVMFAMNLGGMIMLESTLSFLGIGIQIPTASWGNMIASAYQYIFTNPGYAVSPGVCLTLVVIAFNIIGDALRDSLDPKLRGKL